jgi:hypothetical protein
MVALNKTKAKKEIEFLCTECGNTTPKWVGKCPFCGAWNTLKEHAVEPAIEGPRASRGLGGPIHQVVTLKDVATEDTRRLSTANTEFDRVLGGGLAPGSLVLIGGDPGIGKSTLVLTTLATMTAAGVKCLYVSGEESACQVKLRSERLNVSGSDMLLLCETSLEKIVEHAKVAGVHFYTPPLKATVCAAEGYVVVQAREEGPLEIDFGKEGPVVDFLTGEQIGTGPKVSLPFKKGETKIFQVVPESASY